MTRQLIVLRHSKAERGAYADHDRPLTARGRRDALAAGRWLAEHDVKPDLTLCSTAARAKETWALAAMELGDGVPTTFERDIYSGDVDELLACIRDTSDDVRTLLMVGHNPTLQDLVLTLAGAGDPEPIAAARHDFSTSALARLELSGKWKAIDPGVATLLDFTVARG
ncbi:MAG TPA: histidine phosphatase family protein [Sporichthyaceae bacterium]|jgi:phosphohistidine phosphatase|nr:histidine phosphatase family protein [Sporichthyaceae bacterium]